MSKATPTNQVYQFIPPWPHVINVDKGVLIEQGRGDVFMGFRVTYNLFRGRSIFESLVRKTRCQGRDRGQSLMKRFLESIEDFSSSETTIFKANHGKVISGSKTWTSNFKLHLSWRFKQMWKMYCSISISVFVFLPSLECIPVSVFPNTFCLYLKCISDTYRDTLLQMYFSISILATILMYPSICIFKYIFEYFCPSLPRWRKPVVPERWSAPISPE